MLKTKTLCFLMAFMFTLSACSGDKPKATAQNIPPPPSQAVQELELNDDMSGAITGVMEALGPAPNNVVAFGLGFRRPKGTAVTVAESAVLFDFYRNGARIFESDQGNMGCSPTVDIDRLLEYDPMSTNNSASGYGKGNSTFMGKAGYTKYDALGNIDASLGKTVAHFVSVDKTVRKSGSKEAQAVIDISSAYAYWIESLPDENILKGTVFNKGADDRKDEPVKKGTLYFKRIGPSPSSIDEQVEVRNDGTYNAEGILTAGHYEVSFDPRDGKGKKVINPNWLYIPGEWKASDKDWYVLVRNTYHITYDHLAKLADTGTTVNTLHMEWSNIPIDWLVESEDAYLLAAQAGFEETYCLTYDYVNAEEKKQPPSQENVDESETDIIPGYYPDVFRETPLSSSSGTFRLPYVPTLSFYRGAEEGGFVHGGFYVSIPVEINVFVDNGVEYGTALAPGVFDPMTVEQEAFFRGQGWDDWAFMGRIDLEKVEGLIEKQTPLEISYKHSNGAYVTVTVSIEK